MGKKYAITFTLNGAERTAEIEAGDDNVNAS